MRKLRQLCLIAWSIFVVGVAVIWGIPAPAQASPLSSDSPNYCTPPKPGSHVPKPPNIDVAEYNQSNPLELSAAIADSSSGLDCFITDAHKIAPTLRVDLGGQINMRLTNELQNLGDFLLSFSTK
ncbi:MAG: hypothetical protein DSM106950_09525 [Stigonema ocellatum SAG 48.90 = DSM 106950]|nr:hypothetical protein [Stigonema ocellatum SAG 48.90 = DSM 106950]